MLLTRELGFRVGEALSPPSVASVTCRRLQKLGSYGLDPRPVGGSAGDVDFRGNSGIRAAPTAGELLMRLNGAEGKEFGGFSHESEHDLALMVNDFLENGSGGADSRYSSDSDSGFSVDLANLTEKVMFHKHAMTQYESDLQTVVHSILSSLNEVDLYLVNEDKCNGSCIRQELVKRLKFSGYDAAVCTSKWLGFDKVPGGDHEYIDVVFNDLMGSERLIVDIDFRSHFEIARAVESYDAILSSLPVVYVGSLPRLTQFLQVMVDAAKFSLKQNSMPLPPWRSFSYLQAKWYSKYERKHDFDKPRRLGSGCDHKQCFGHFQRLKSSLQMEYEAERLIKPIVHDKKRRVKSERRRPSLLRC